MGKFDVLCVKIIYSYLLCNFFIIVVSIFLIYTKRLLLLVCIIIIKSYEFTIKPAYASEVLYHHSELILETSSSLIFNVQPFERRANMINVL